MAISRPRRALHGGVLNVSVILTVGCVLTSLSQSAALTHPGTPPVSAALTESGTTTVNVESPETVRADRLSDVTVTFTGIDAKTKVRVNWGDGTPTLVRKGPCSPKGAKAQPQGCSVTFTPGALAPGQLTITASTGKLREQKTVNVVPAPAAWRPPDGWVQPPAWAILGSGATYTPCQRVDWYFDRAGESGDRSTMIEDVRGALSTLSSVTGLVFNETADPAQADLSLNWGDLTARGPSVAGVGGPVRPGYGSVTFSTTSRWTTNEWLGTAVRRVEWPRPDLGPGWYSYLVLPGRQVLAIHEIMHAMGFGHVTDFTSIMYPQGLTNGAGSLSAGDIEGLRTMYPSNPCPPIPD